VLQNAAEAGGIDNKIFNKLTQCDAFILAYDVNNFESLKTLDILFELL